ACDIAVLDQKDVVVPIQNNTADAQRHAARKLPAEVEKAPQQRLETFLKSAWSGFDARRPRPAISGCQPQIQSSTRINGLVMVFRSRRSQTCFPSGMPTSGSDHHPRSLPQKIHGV